MELKQELNAKIEAVKIEIAAVEGRMSTKIDSQNADIIKMILELLTKN